MTVTLYTFSKKVNSTARPSGGTSYNGTIRDSSGTTSPSISFGCFNNSSPASYNYAYIAVFNRYYYIETWVFDNGLWYAEMRVDVLASWKTYIGASSNYVLRAAADYNGRVIDNLYPVAARHGYSSVNFDYGIPSGAYIVGVIGGNGGNGAVSYYQMTAAQFTQFAADLMSTTSWTGFIFDANTGLTADGLTEETVKALLNPAQYIQSVKWVPYAPVQPNTVAAIPLGWWNVPTTAQPVVSTTGNVSFDVTLPVHPDVATRGEFLRTSPYTRYTARVMPFGDFVLDTTRVLDGKIGVIIDVDVISGDGVLQIFDSGVSGQYLDLLAYAEKRVAVDIVLAQQSQNVAGAAMAVINGAAGAASSAMKFDFGNSAASAANGIVSALQAMVPQVTTIGAQGSWASYMGYSFVSADFAFPVDEDNTNLGRPLCEVRQLSTLSGYQLIGNPEIVAPCSKSEHDEIISYLSNGYFYE